MSEFDKFIDEYDQMFPEENIKDYIASEETKIEFGDKVKKMRNEEGLSIREFAKLVDLPVKYVKNIEKGNVYPTQELVGKVTRPLGKKAKMRVSLEF